MKEPSADDTAAWVEWRNNELRKRMDKKSAASARRKARSKAGKVFLRGVKIASNLVPIEEILSRSKVEIDSKLEACFLLNEYGPILAYLVALNGPLVYRFSVSLDKAKKRRRIKGTT